MAVNSTNADLHGSDHKEFSSMLHKALEGAIILETFPKTTVDVFALVLESGGNQSVIHCVINNLI
ncbi:putative ribosomal protein S5 domain 2-type [Rosa chinensis]|uniref:Putative ribosomal protein S5 domain 2-type n=1 Tax=Rosa chinensis TaxID=74649 RepID=A0A2P6SD54_ROSCH|nr:putative ribosomal protein S5 domain 2-type [Rosa chinensis]